MSKVYLPTGNQMNTTLENLERIVGALGVDADVSSWAAIERVVKSGNAPHLFPIGTQFTVYSDVYEADIVFDVVAHDYFKSAKDEKAHTMTLMCHNPIDSGCFDAPEAFYYAENELPAGTYNFTIVDTYVSWAAGTYQFTLTKSLPKGGHLCISGDASVKITERSVVAYPWGPFMDEETGDITPSEEVAITIGNAGTSLGAFGVELNHAQRVSYGSNNYKESSIRQFLNTGQFWWEWTPQTKFDRRPSNVSMGFPPGLDEEFLKVVGEVIVPCVANNNYESLDSTIIKGEKYTVTDKFYLASQTEIYGTSEGVIDDNSVQFPYYKGATNADRVKYSDTLSPQNWWTRTAVPWYADSVRVVRAAGNLTAYGASTPSVYVVPVCTIV